MILGTDLHRYGKPRSPPGFDTRTVQPVQNRYTDHVIPAHFTKNIKTNYCAGYRSDFSIHFIFLCRDVEGGIALSNDMGCANCSTTPLLELYKKPNSIFLSSTLMSGVGS